MFLYLLLMSFLCLIGFSIYIYLSFVKYASDTRWLVLSAVGAFMGILHALYLCWGVTIIVGQSAALGVYQCFQCMDSTGSLLTGTCDSLDECDSNSWKIITTVDECSPATANGIACELTRVCYYTAPYTFWYSSATTLVFIFLLLLTGGVIYGRLIPSFVIQSIKRSRII